MIMQKQDTKLESKYGNSIRSFFKKTVIGLGIFYGLMLHGTPAKVQDNSELIRQLNQVPAGRAFTYEQLSPAARKNLKESGDVKTLPTNEGLLGALAENPDKEYDRFIQPLLPYLEKLELSINNVKNECPKSVYVSLNSLTDKVAKEGGFHIEVSLYDPLSMDKQMRAKRDGNKYVIEFPSVEDYNNFVERLINIPRNRLEDMVQVIERFTKGGKKIDVASIYFDKELMKKGRYNIHLSQCEEPIPKFPPSEPKVIPELPPSEPKVIPEEEGHVMFAIRETERPDVQTQPLQPELGGEPPGLIDGRRCRPLNHGHGGLPGENSNNPYGKKFDGKTHGKGSLPGKNSRNDNKVFDSRNHGYGATPPGVNGKKGFDGGRNNACSGTSGRGSERGGHGERDGGSNSGKGGGNSGKGGGRGGGRGGK